MEKKERLIKTGIIGGTFNPIHMGHLILAENAYDTLKLDKVVFMPTGKSYLKDPSQILDSSVRIKMIEESIKGNEHFVLSDYETKKEGNTYTSETLSELTELYPDDEFYFIIGEDSIYNIETWYDPQTIFDKCVLVVAPRDHEPDEKLINIKDHLTEKYGARIVLLDAPDIDISSSMIRKRVAEGRSIRYYVSDGVRDIIIKNGYYK
ncbi:MAG: nicotinate-nucleotide adenylyltransferase [Lachnospiraceae bacterium]|nr:nicotinate-nucleotide adenylyltransferase [Lachnospiraceae bacterium]